MVIRKLEETVVNRIAAGEVVQRPVNAIKEMIENSLDAKSTQVQVTLKDGGLKLIQITDNGCGISKEDMNVVCERFTTSKLKEFNDLRTIDTHGFRGEALASISHVAHVSITTRTADSKCAYRGEYTDSILKAPVKPCAGNVGTTIVVEDLFYNTPLRKRTLKSPREEHSRIVDMVGKYALHNSHVSFTVRKSDEKGGHPDIKTTANSTQIDNVKLLYGSNVGRELLEFEHKDESLRFEVKGLLSNANYSNRNIHFILFINHRLVSCTNLRKALENVYESILLKGNYPFVYLSLEIAPQNVDVNVHPTKHEVQFLHDDAIIFSIQQAVERSLMSSKESRTFITKSLIPEKVSSVTEVMDKSRVVDMVRTDAKSQKLDAFLVSNPKIPSISSSSLNKSNNEQSSKEDSMIAPESKSTSNTVRREINLISLKAMQQKIKDCCSFEWRNNFRKLTFVGCIDEELCVAQLETQLLLLNMRRLTEDFFYQTMCFDFGNYGVMQLSEPAPISDLVMLALEYFKEECGWNENDPSREFIAKKVNDLLISRSVMLWDYFSMKISDKGEVLSLPLLLDRYVPNLDLLPVLIVRLGTEVNWNEEAACFETFCQQMAWFYALRKPPIKSIPTDISHYKWTVENVIFLKLKTSYLPSKHMHEGGSILQLTDVSKLYKVFERC